MAKKQDDPREWEHWLVIVGACLASKTAREHVFANLAPDDCPYVNLQGILRSMKTEDVEGIKGAIAEFYFLQGVDWSDGCLAGIVGKVKKSAAKRRAVKEALEKLNEARNL